MCPSRARSTRFPATDASSPSATPTATSCRSSNARRREDSASVDWTEFMQERPLAVLATVGRDGVPHAVPVEVFVYGGKVYAWSESDSVKVANVRRTGKA